MLLRFLMNPRNAIHKWQSRVLRVTVSHSSSMFLTCDMDRKKGENQTYYMSRASWCSHIRLDHKTSNTILFSEKR